MPIKAQTKEERERQREGGGGGGGGKTFQKSRKGTRSQETMPFKFLG